MPFAAALSTRPGTAAAVDEVCAGTQDQLPATPDLVLAFFSPHHLENAENIAREFQERLAPAALLGCVGESIIGNDEEIEDRPALAVWAAHFKTSPAPVEITSFQLSLEKTSEGYSLLGWPDELVVADCRSSAMLVLGDPNTFPTDFFLKQINTDSPGLRVLGGMASGVWQRGACRLLRDSQVLTSGAVGVLLRGPVGLRSLVSQGCRPIGRHLVVTRADGNIIEELGGRSPLSQLQELWPTLSAREQQLFRAAPHIGRVINEAQGEFHRGDFLVRNIVGMDRETGAIAITDQVRPGQTVQFHIRDATSADEDLQALLRHEASAAPGPAGALVFSCNGRGTRLFDAPHHDARAIRQTFGPIPLAGFFAAGELGPVGGQNFIHGFTASVALFAD